MDNSFELHSTLTLEGLRNLYRFYYFKILKWWVHGCIGLVVLSLIASLYYLIGFINSGLPISYFFDWGGLYSIIYLLMSILFGFLPFHKVRLEAKKAYNKHNASKLPKQSTQIVDDIGVATKNEQANNLYKWEQIMDGYLYKNTIFLSCGNGFIPLKLADLVQGRPSDLLEYIEQKIILKKY